jgi:hypothetical protein
VGLGGSEILGGCSGVDVVGLGENGAGVVCLG